MVEFVTQRLGIEGVSLLFLAIAVIYMWYQHHRAKLLQERITLIDEKRKDMSDRLERSLKSSGIVNGRNESQFSSAKTSSMNKSILIAEDDTSLRQVLADVFLDHFKGVNVVTAVDGEEAISKIENATPSVIVLDMMMPQKTGYDVLRELVNRNLNIPVIIQSGYVTESNFRPGAPVPKSRLTFFPKPYNLSDMIQVIEKLLHDEKK